MKISIKRQTKLYKCIADEIMDYRLILMRLKPTHETMDRDLFYLSNRIWKKVCKVFNIED